MENNNNTQENIQNDEVEEVEVEKLGDFETSKDVSRPKQKKNYRKNNWNT